MAGGGVNPQMVQQLGQQLSQQNSYPYGIGSLPPSGFMQYPQQGQPNTPPQVQNSGGPDAGAPNPATNMGLDNGGLAGQGAQMQSPLTAPNPLAPNSPMASGLQIQGNPTSMPVNPQGKPNG